MERQISGMSPLERELGSLKPQEKRALADWLWLAAERSPVDGEVQIESLNARAELALEDSTKRFPLGDAEKKLRR